MRFDFSRCEFSLVPAATYIFFNQGASPRNDGLAIDVGGQPVMMLKFRSVAASTSWWSKLARWGS